MCFFFYLSKKAAFLSLIHYKFALINTICFKVKLWFSKNFLFIRCESRIFFNKSGKSLIKGCRPLDLSVEEEFVLAKVNYIKSKKVVIGSLQF